MLEIRKFIVNPLQENSFVVSDETGKCIFIDPGFYFQEERSKLKKYISENNLDPVMIANTHCHFDHIMGVEFLRNEYDIPFLAHPEDAIWVENAVEQGEMFGFRIEPVNMPDSFLTVDEPLKFGNSVLQVMHIPGHSPGHVVFYSEEDAILISGDVLFYGSIGRSDLLGGDHKSLVSNIKEKLFTLPAGVRVLCGHGPDTDLDRERSSNPFLT